MAHPFDFKDAAFIQYHTFKLRHIEVIQLLIIGDVMPLRTHLAWLQAAHQCQTYQLHVSFADLPASGANSITMQSRERQIASAHDKFHEGSCQVLVPAKSAERPRRNAHFTISAWCGKRHSGNSGISINPVMGSLIALLAKNAL